MIGESVIAGIVEGVVSKLVEKLEISKYASTALDAEVARSSIRQHLGMIARWADEITFKDLGKARKLSDSFVDLDLHLGQTRTASNRAATRAFRVSDIPDLPGNLVVLVKCRFVCSFSSGLLELRRSA